MPNPLPGRFSHKEACLPPVGPATPTGARHLAPALPGLAAPVAHSRPIPASFSAESATSEVTSYDQTVHFTGSERKLCGGSHVLTKRSPCRHIHAVPQRTPTPTHSLTHIHMPGHHVMYNEDGRASRIPGVDAVKAHTVLVGPLLLMGFEPCSRINSPFPRLQQTAQGSIVCPLFWVEGQDWSRGSTQSNFARLIFS